MVQQIWHPMKEGCKVKSTPSLSVYLSCFLPLFLTISFSPIKQMVLLGKGLYILLLCMYTILLCILVFITRIGKHFFLILYLILFFQESQSPMSYVEKHKQIQIGEGGQSTRTYSNSNLHITTDEHIYFTGWFQQCAFENIFFYLSLGQESFTVSYLLRN